MAQILLAIISPNKDAYSETFIRAHINIPGVTVRIYNNGFLPKRLQSKGSLEPTRASRQIISRLKYLWKQHRLTYSEWLLFRSFKKENIQVVLAEYGPTACSVLEVCRVAKLPLLVHFHGFDASKKEVLQMYQSCYLDVFRYASAVFAVSSAMQTKLQELGCPPEKIYLNPYGPNPDFLKINPSFSENYFISIGRFVDKKAPYYVILAFSLVNKKHPDSRLVMIGDGPLLNTCKNLVRQLGIENQISFPGVLHREDIETFFKNAVAFVQHSITAENGDMEGTPVAVLEASAAALPVISTRHAGIPDVVIQGETGFLCAEHDVQQMAEYMMKVVENNALAKIIGQRGRELIRQKFTLEKHLKILSDTIINTVD